MKLYPYSTVETSHLKSLLLAARLLGGLSYIMLVVSMLISVFGVLASFAQPMQLGRGMTATIDNLTVTSFSAGFAFLVPSLFLLAFSGICAAIVSCEHKYTSTTCSSWIS